LPKPCGCGVMVMPWVAVMCVSLFYPRVVSAVPVCAVMNDPYISRIPTDKLMLQLSEEDRQCYTHVPRDGLSITDRSHPVLWDWTPDKTCDLKEAGDACNLTANNKSSSASQHGFLSQEQLNHFESHGFLFVRGILDPETIDRWQGLVADTINQLNPEVPRDRMGSMQSQNVTLNGLQVTADFVMEPQKLDAEKPPTIKSFYNAHTSVLALEREEFQMNRRLARSVEQILGSPVYLSQSRLNLQQPFSGVGFNWHSDFETWHSEDGMPLPRCVSVVLPFNKMTEFNGPVMFIPGSHRYYAHGFQDALHSGDNYKTSLSHQYLGGPTPDQLAWLFKRAEEQFGQGIFVGNMDKGDALLFDCNVLHGSSNNISPLGRSAAFLVYNSIYNAMEDKPFANQRTEVRPGYLGAHGDGEVQPIP